MLAAQVGDQVLTSLFLDRYFKFKTSRFAVPYFPWARPLHWLRHGVSRWSTILFYI